MAFESEFRALLTGSAAVTALVPSGRINWSENPQGAAAPYIVLHLIGNAEGLHLKGGTGLFEGRVQVDCYARTPSEAIAVGAAVGDLLQAYSAAGFRLIRLSSTRGPRRDGGATDPDRTFCRSHDFITHWRATNGD